MVYHESAVRHSFIAGLCYFYDQYVIKRKHRFNRLWDFGNEDVTYVFLLGVIKRKSAGFKEMI